MVQFREVSGLERFCAYMYSKYREQDLKTPPVYREGSRLQRVRFREVPLHVQLDLIICESSGRTRGRGGEWQIKGESGGERGRGGEREREGESGGERGRGGKVGERGESGRSRGRVGERGERGNCALPRFC